MSELGDTTGCAFQESFFFLGIAKPNYLLKLETLGDEKK